MKRFHIFSLIAGCFLLASCVEDIDRTDNSKVIGGIPVTATLPFQTSTSNNVTKATAADEDAIYDLYVVIFEEDGTFSSAQYFSTEQLQAFNLVKANSVKIQTLSGRKKIFAVANVTDNSFSEGTKHLKADIDAFIKKTGSNTLSHWKGLTAWISQPQVTWGEGRFLMTGFFSNSPGKGDQLFDDSADGLCVIDDNGNVKTAGKIELARTVSSFTFNISAGTGVTFEPTSWHIVNAAKSVYLYKQDGYGIPEKLGSFSTFETTPDKVSGNTINFYLLENRQEAQLPNPGLLNTYEEADWREDRENNAPGKGTYLVLKGLYKGKEVSPFLTKAMALPTTDVEATVTYYIHLGYIKSADDFDVLRNYKYTYNVQVNGIKNIIIEASDGTETKRADGDAFFYDAEVINVDAHYERVELTFNNINYMDKFLCGIQTAKTGWGYVALDQATGTKDDTNWVYFIDKTALNADRPNFKDPAASGLMTIRELSAKFNAGDYDGDNVTFYAYVSENYYDDGLPLNEFISYESTTGELKSRMMMISVTRKKAGNSSVSTSKYIIKQKPIITIYNMANPTVRNSKTFGMEWINENLPASYYTSTSFADKAALGLTYDNTGVSPKANASRTDGLYNQKRELTNRSWSSNDIRQYEDQSRARAYAACMSRNRDEDGDGTISDDEIKWYLPALNQYLYVWNGMEALPDAATLYPKEFRDAKTWQFYHFASSGAMTFWSEEGCATSGYLTSHLNGKKHIRCARNMGPKEVLDQDGAPIAIAEKSEPEDENYIVLDVAGRLVNSSLRDHVGSTLTRHNEYGGTALGLSGSNNRLYKGQLLVQKESFLISDNTSWKNVMNLMYTNNPCAKYGEGWRAPNQRELILLSTVGGFGPNADFHTFAGTYFSFVDIASGGGGTPMKTAHPDDKNNARIGFTYSDDGRICLDLPSKIGIRCVKDN